MIPEERYICTDDDDDHRYEVKDQRYSRAHLVQGYFLSESSNPANLLAEQPGPGHSAGRADVISKVMVPLRFVLPAIAVICAAVLIVRPARAERHIGSYPRMAPLTQYMMDRNAEIALARSAAPPSISKASRVLVLTRHGYAAAVNGSNGFTCLVERNWMSAFDDPQFWNPKGRGAICYNPPASRTVLRYDYERTKLALSGLSKSRIYARLKAAVAKRELPTPEAGSMSFMMSKHQYLNDQVGNWYPHLMFYAPRADGANAGASWGANLPASPVVMDSAHTLWPEPQTIFFIPVSKWSDGTPAPP